VLFKVAFSFRVSLTACECDDDATDGGALPPETAVSANQLFWFLVSSGHLQSAAIASFILLFPLISTLLLLLSLLLCQELGLTSFLDARPPRRHSSRFSLLHLFPFSSFPQALGFFPQALGLASEGFFFAHLSCGARDTQAAMSPFFSTSPLSTAVSPSPHLPPVLPSLLLFLFLLPPPSLCPCF